MDRRAAQWCRERQSYLMDVESPAELYPIRLEELALFLEEFARDHRRRWGVNEHARVQQLLVLLASKGNLPEEDLFRRLSSLLGPIVVANESEQAEFRRRLVERGPQLLRSRPATPLPDPSPSQASTPDPEPGEVHLPTHRPPDLSCFEGPDAAPGTTGAGTSGRPSAEGALERERRKRPGWRTVAMGLVISLLFWALFIFSRIGPVGPVGVPSPSPSPSPGASPTAGPSDVPTTVPLTGSLLITKARKFSIGERSLFSTSRAALSELWRRGGVDAVAWGAALALVFAVVVVWYRRRRARLDLACFLERRFSDDVTGRKRLWVGGNTDTIFGRFAVTRAAQQLRTHGRLEECGVLDVDATVDRMARNGGVFTRVAARRRQPKVLALVEWQSRADHQARLVEVLLGGLRCRGLSVEICHVGADLRNCRLASGVCRTLSELALQFPDHRLLVFSDGEGLMDRVTGEPSSRVDVLVRAWSRRTLLTPVPPRDWAWREQSLRQTGLSVLPFDAESLGRALDGPVLSWPEATARREQSRPMPTDLVREAHRWTSDSVPPKPWADQGLEELWFYLGPGAFEWLASLAVYPEIHWDLTIGLGHRLDPALVSIEPMRALVNLPWLRTGRMPQWLRQRLVERLSPERLDIVRSYLREVLSSATAPEAGGLGLDVVIPGEGGPTSGSVLGGDVPPDPVFLSSMQTRLGVEVPRAVARLLRGGTEGERGRVTPPPGPGGLLATVGASLAEGMVGACTLGLHLWVGLAVLLGYALCIASSRAASGDGWRVARRGALVELASLWAGWCALAALVYGGSDALAPLASWRVPLLSLLPGLPGREALATLLVAGAVAAQCVVVGWACLEALGRLRRGKPYLFWRFVEPVARLARGLLFSPAPRVGPVLEPPCADAGGASARERPVPHWSRSGLIALAVAWLLPAGLERYVSSLQVSPPLEVWWWLSGMLELLVIAASASLGLRLHGLGDFIRGPRLRLARLAFDTLLPCVLFVGLGSPFVAAGAAWTLGSAWLVIFGVLALVSGRSALAGLGQGVARWFPDRVVEGQRTAVTVSVFAVLLLVAGMPRVGQWVEAIVPSRVVVAISNCGRLVAVTRAEDDPGLVAGSIRLWSLDGGSEGVRELPWGYPLAFSPNGRQLAAGRAGGSVRVWTVSPAGRGEKPIDLSGEGNLPTLAWLADGKSAPGGRGAPDARKQATLAWSADGKTLVGCTTDAKACVWKLTDPFGGLLRYFSVEEKTGVMAVNGNGGFIATAAVGSSTVWAWSAADGRYFRVGRCSAPVTALAFSPDGVSLAIGSEDGVTRIWKFGGPRARILPGLTGRVLAVAFTPDGRSVVAVASGGDIGAWSLAATSEAVTWEKYIAADSELESAAFSPGGCDLVTTSRSGRGEVWALSLRFAGRNSKGFNEFENLRDGSALIEVPGGSFTMGSDSKDASDDEKPLQLVGVKGFYIGKYDVTNAQFQDFVQATGYDAGTEWKTYADRWGARAPVVCVSWYDAVAYCNWSGLRLPTEAEWEYAARGPRNLTWPWGNEWDSSRAVTGESSKGRAASVGSRPSGASPFGVLDTAGNVSQWCSSNYQPYPYRVDDEREDPGGEADRVMRGGSWRGGAWDARSASRFRWEPTYRHVYVGFRVARGRGASTGRGR